MRRETFGFRLVSPVAPKEAVATVSQVLTLDKGVLTERAGKLPRIKVELASTWSGTMVPP